MEGFSLTQLERIVRMRAAEPADESYTAKLMAGGMDRIAKKFGEEAVEAVIAAIAGKPVELKKEAADVLYHLLVMLHASGVPLAEVMDELSRRTGQSGLAEKAGRKAG
ncbi:MAG: phosphoribosyl-ATP diphosphatase [Beijerinckiaceae bacterium]